MKVKVLSFVAASLVVIVIGLSAFIAYDQWPDADSYTPVYRTAPNPQLVPTCSKDKTFVLKIGCLKYGGEACTAYANCVK